MTRRKKSKTTASSGSNNRNATPFAPKSAPDDNYTAVTRVDVAPSTLNVPTASRIASPKTTASAIGSNASHASSNHTVVSSSSRRTVASSSTSHEVANSVKSVASTGTSENSRMTSNSSKTKKPVRTIVKYVTKQMYIQPRHQILTVERLPNFDYHVRAITELLGWRPRVYPHGKGVRFVPESNEEYRIMQRYLARIESEERIAWCSHTLPPGNSLKVNIKVRVVEFVEIEKDLQKLSLQTCESSARTKQTDCNSVVVQATLSPRQDDTKPIKSAQNINRLAPTNTGQTSKNNNVVQRAVVQARS